MRTLIIAPHMDDEAISCGGFIANRLSHERSTCIVHVMTLFGRVYDYGRADGTAQEEGDFLKAKEILNYHGFHHLRFKEGEPQDTGYYKMLMAVEAYMRSYRPTEVIIPGATDLNQDHRFLNHVCQIALRPINIGRVERVLEFIPLDGTVQTPNYFVPLTRAELDLKIQSVKAYERESRGGFSPRSPDNIVAQAAVWGSMINQPYAEGYILRKGID